MAKAKQRYKLVKSLFGKYEEIPEDWEVKRLGDLGEPIIGLTYEPKNVKSDGVLVLRASNIQDSRLRFEDNVFVDVKIKDRLKIKKGDLLICVRNGSKRLIGKCAYIDRNFENMTFGAFMSVFRSQYNQFLFHQFHTPLIRKQVTKSITFTINQITNQNLNSFQVLFPPIKEQQKIASILSNVDNLIDSYGDIIDVTKKLKIGLMQQLLTKGIGHTKFKKVKWFFGKELEIPEEWEYLKFSEVVNINPLTKINMKIVPYIPMDAVNTSKPNIGYFEERKLNDFSNLPRFQENDVLFASITPSTENGKTCIIENFSKEGIASSELTVLRPTEKIIPRYLYYYVKNHRVRQFAISQMMGSTGRQRVPTRVFKQDLNFEVPPESEQYRIISILSEIDSKLNGLDFKKTNLEKLKKGLMQKLLTGQIRVKV